MLLARIQARCLVRRLRVATTKRHTGARIGDLLAPDSLSYSGSLEFGGCLIRRGHTGYLRCADLLKVALGRSPDNLMRLASERRVSTDKRSGLACMHLPKGRGRWG